MSVGITNHRGKRKLLLLPFGAIAIILVVASGAWACGVFQGTITVGGNYPSPGGSNVIVKGDGSDTNHIWAATGPVAAARSCFTSVSPNCIADGNLLNSWVDVTTGANGTAKLQDSSLDFVQMPCLGDAQTDLLTNGNATYRVGCALGDATGLDIPGVTIKNKVGDYYVNLDMYQWVDAMCPENNPGGTTFAPGCTLPDGQYNTQHPEGSNLPAPLDALQNPVMIVGQPVPSEVTSGRVAYFTGCNGFNHDQTWRVLHLGRATIDSTGAISAASRTTTLPPNDPPFIDVYGPLGTNLVTPQPKLMNPPSGSTYRFYFPATLPTSVTPVNGSGLMASALCVVDRYGINALQAPVEMMVL